jgi:hypothetical protein
MLVEILVMEIKMCAKQATLQETEEKSQIDEISQQQGVFANPENQQFKIYESNV